MGEKDMGVGGLKEKGMFKTSILLLCHYQQATAAKAIKDNKQQQIAGTGAVAPSCQVSILFKYKERETPTTRERQNFDQPYVTGFIRVVD